MYPIIRLINAIWQARRLPKIGFFDTHETWVRVYPWDLDIFLELNNGRTLTLFDLPRTAIVYRNGVDRIMKNQGLRFTIMGSLMRYQRRVTVFQKLRITVQCVGVDEKFLYLLQTAYRGDQPVSQGVFRASFVKDGIYSPLRALEIAGVKKDIPELPDWVSKWIETEAMRPWPPTL